MLILYSNSDLFEQYHGEESICGLTHKHTMNETSDVSARLQEPSIKCLQVKCTDTSFLPTCEMLGIVIPAIDQPRTLGLYCYCWFMLVFSVLLVSHIIYLLLFIGCITCDIQCCCGCVCIKRSGW